MRRILFCLVILSAGAGGASAMERGFSWTYAPAEGDNISADLAAFPLGKYFEACQVNRPEVVNEAKALLAQGKYYRKRILDQKGKGTILTVFVDRDRILHVVTHRNETCPECGGTGKRGELFGAIPARIRRNVGIRFKCLKCNGEGELKNFTTERFFTLSPEDYENVQMARQLYSEQAYAKAPPQSEAWVERLASGNPRERLDACLWLDGHYVKTGTFFQDIMPMLRKARYHEASEKQRMLVWQFWAGKDVPGEQKRYYYRIYADSRSGRITQKGFYAAR